ncbi:hypothetical protein [Methanosarcina horonobensis]|uniref:hypothetical protein n=1 Tax=Methanosarcina horonobensis TaxID=418008 RepID=UPI000A7CE1D4|nr:hypothetical protein [Methanosarcina horonobensis]
MPPLAEVNALGKVLMVEAEEPLKGETEENLIKAADLVEIDSLIKTGPKVKIGFVPGMEKKICQNQVSCENPTFCRAQITEKETGSRRAPELTGTL